MPVASSLIRTETYFAVGGYDPLISSGEDIDLYRRIALLGDAIGTPNIVSCIVRNRGQSTTDHAEIPNSTRWAREKILNMPDVFTIMRESANSSYWRGRIVRAYLTSTLWNLWRGNLFTSLSRVVYGIGGFVLAVKSIFSPDFWTAIAKEYESFAFARGLAEREKTKQKNL